MLCAENPNMDGETELKNAAISYMQEYGALRTFHIIAANHSKTSSESSSPYTPLILELEVDLIRLFDCSSDLYVKLVEYPAAGRWIFQEALAESLKKSLLAERCRPLTCLALLLRCTFLPKLIDADSLYAKSYGCLSHMTRHVLTSVTISRSNTCNVATICVLSRCPNESCPGHAGRYASTRDIQASELLGNCSYCSRKCVEDPAGRGQVCRVMAKFMPVGAFNDRNEKPLYRSVTCSITEPLTKELELGDMYDLWGRYDASIYEVWGLKRKSFFTERPPIPLSPFPPSVRLLIDSLGEPEPRNPWILARRLALELGSNVYRKDAAVSLKMGLLLSLATLGSERCAPILCVGPNVDIVEEDIMNFAASCADRSVYVRFPLGGSITKNGEHIWLHGESLIRAKTGVCNFGNWECLRPAQKNDILKVLDDGCIATDVAFGRRDNNRASVSATMECLPAPLPLRTAVWTYRTCDKNAGKRQSNDLENLVRVFGIPFLVDAETDLTAEDIHERLEIFLHGGKVNPRTVPLDELIQFLRVINGIAVKVSEKAVKLMNHYFVTCRRLRGDVFPARSITFMTTLAEAHARLSLRNEVTCDDVTAVIYLHEEAMTFLYGYTVSTPPSFAKFDVDTVGEKMEAFKSWLAKHLKSVIG